MAAVAGASTAGDLARLLRGRLQESTAALINLVSDLPSAAAAPANNLDTKIHIGYLGFKIYLEVAMAAKVNRNQDVEQTDDVDVFINQRAVESPGINTEGMAIFGRISRIASRLAPHMEALFARHGLERGEFDVLATLQRNGPPYRLSPTAL